MLLVFAYVSDVKSKTNVNLKSIYLSKTNLLRSFQPKPNDGIKDLKWLIIFIKLIVLRNHMKPNEVTLKRQLILLFTLYYTHNYNIGYNRIIHNDDS